MDLDGTSVHSEPFWIWIIQMTVATLLGNPASSWSSRPAFRGRSPRSRHLTYCMRTYCPGRTLEEARATYFEHTHRELDALLAGSGRREAIQPAPGLPTF